MSSQLSHLQTHVLLAPLSLPILKLPFTQQKAISWKITSPATCQNEKKYSPSPPTTPKLQTMHCLQHLAFLAGKPWGVCSQLIEVCGSPCQHPHRRSLSNPVSATHKGVCDATAERERGRGATTQTANLEIRVLRAGRDSQPHFVFLRLFSPCMAPWSRDIR